MSIPNGLQSSIQGSIAAQTSYLQAYLRLLWNRSCDPSVVVQIRFIFFCLYPFLITSALAAAEHATLLAIGRLALATIYNIIFFLIVLYLLRLSGLRVSTWLPWALLMFLAVFTFVSVAHFQLYGQLLGLPSIYTIIDTTPEEAFEFLNSTIRFDRFFIAWMLTSPILWPILLPRPLPSLKVRRPIIAWVSAAALLVCCSIAGVLAPYLYMNNPVLLIGQTVRRAILEKQTVERLYETMPAPRSTRQLSDRQPVTHILVIGESTTSRHMSLFGYVRKTTPTLDRLKPELEIAADACSSQTTTIAQMKELLTFATREDPSPLFRAPSLVQIMKSEGFKIYWLSNQQMVGPTDTWSAVFSKPADVRIFTDKRGGFEGASHDGKLLPLLREALTDPAGHRFIVLHLMGTHVHYDLRYPREFARFNDSQGVHPGVLQKGGWYITRYTQYDNAVLYNDYILGEIISQLKAVERGTLTYVSDHGEVLGETSSATGHWGGDMPRQGYQVPLLFYLTPKVKAELGERLAVFRRNLAVPIQTDRLIHTLLDLYDIRDEEWRPEQSLFSPHFSPSPRQCDTRPE